MILIGQERLQATSLIDLPNTEQLRTAQKSEFGLPIGQDYVSDTGHADDIALLSNGVNQLQHLLSCLQLRFSTVHSLLFFASSGLLLLTPCA